MSKNADNQEATDYERLRLETAQLLGLNPDQLSPAESLKLNLCSLLQLQVDFLQGQALSGAEVDMTALSAAVNMLGKLLPAEYLQAPTRDAERAKACEDLIKLVDDCARARKVEMADSPNRVRAALEQDITAAVAELGADPAIDRRSDDAKRIVELEELLAAKDIELASLKSAAPKPPEPAPAPREAASGNVTPLKARENSAHRLWTDSFYGPGTRL